MSHRRPVECGEGGEEESSGHREVQQTDLRDCMAGRSLQIPESVAVLSDRAQVDRLCRQIASKQSVRAAGGKRGLF